MSALTVGQLRAELVGIPDDARVAVALTRPDGTHQALSVVRIGRSAGASPLEQALEDHVFVIATVPAPSADVTDPGPGGSIDY